MRHAPKTLLLHLATQVINNFILMSPELRDIPPSQIHLTLIVPNIYSLTHCEEIRGFIEAHTSVAEVHISYRTDSMTSFALRHTRGLDSASIERFRTNVLNRKEQDHLRILAFNLGHQTTDLSLILFTRPPQAHRHWNYTGGLQEASPVQRSILARTGTGNGDRRLDYLLANYYNRQVVRTLREFSQVIGKAFSFSFTTEQPETDSSLQREAINRLRVLIARIKESLSENYSMLMTLAEQLRLIDPILDVILQATHLHWERGEATTLRQALSERMVLPRRFPGVWTRLRENLIPGSRFYVPNMETGQLGGEIELFVEDSVRGTVAQLVEMATFRYETTKRSRERLRLFDRHSTFVLVSGPGSQFKPIRKAIVDEFASRSLPKINVAFLDGPVAEWARCIGAITSDQSMSPILNLRELHGTYGFLNALAVTFDDSFRVIDMRKLNTGQPDVVTFNTMGTYYFFYSPRVSVTREDPPRLSDGRTALIQVFQGIEFEVRYDPTNLEITVNGSAVGTVASYGDVLESIYPKVWPEVLMPRR